MDEFNKALNYAFVLLKYRSRTEKEIYEKLSRKKYSKNAIDQTINRLKELEFVDDRKFATEFVKYQLEKGRGIIFIKHELYRRGVDKEILGEVIDNLKPDEEQEYEMAKEIFNKKIKKYQDIPANKIYNRVSGFLARRGFSAEIINKIFREWKKEFKEKLI